jgi:hypothetical protein
MDPSWSIGALGGLVNSRLRCTRPFVLIVQRQIRLALEADPHRLHLHGALIGDVA